MKKYIGSWSVSNGQSYNTGYQDNNLRRLKSLLHNIVKGNAPAGDKTGRWSIYYTADQEAQEPVARGA